MMDAVRRYWKGIIAGAGAVALVVQAALTDDVITDAEKVTIAIAILTAIGVVAKANKPVAARRRR